MYGGVGRAVRRAVETAVQSVGTGWPTAQLMLVRGPNEPERVAPINDLTIRCELAPAQAGQPVYLPRIGLRRAADRVGSRLPARSPGSASARDVRPALGVARQVVRDLEPADPARGPDVSARADGRRVVEACERDVQMVGLIAQGELRAASRAEQAFGRREKR